MWEQYKKTLVRMQIVMWFVAACVFFFSRVWTLALMFLITMQIAAVIGAMWGHRLKGKVDRGRMTVR